MNFVSVIGQGYVGLPLSLAIAKSGFKVFGVERDSSKVNLLNSGKCDLENLDKSLLEVLLRNKKLNFTSNFECIAQSKIILICVPTPLDKMSNPDLTLLVEATTSVGKFLAKDSLVIIESTVATGTTRDILIPILERESGLNRGDFFVSYSPERIDPLNMTWSLKNTPKVIAGFSDESCELAVNFYNNFIDKTVKCQSLEVAETSKLLENAFRLINISFINEMSMFCNKFGIEITEVIQAASSKPYGFLPFYPSIGVGGHCIPVDPLYLSDKAKQVGSPLTMIDKARQINNEMPTYFIRRAFEKIGGLAGKKILILGLSYKPNISDTRESPVEPFIKGLRDKGAAVEWHDDLVGDWNGEKSVALGSNYDLAILATPHDYFDLSKLGNVPILDTHRSL